MNAGKVLIAAPVHPVLTEELEARGYTLLREEKITQERAFELIKDCVGVITSTRLKLNEALLSAAPLLKWIGRMGSGMEVIDVPFAMSKGIQVAASPEGNCNAVGEHALGMLLSVSKRISWSQREVLDGKWLRDANRGFELEGKTVGLIGFGHTGRAFAKKLMGFDVRILAYDPFNKEEDPAYVERATLETLQQEADVISFHVPIGNDTRHYFNDVFITKMSKPFILVNTSRGEVIERSALLKGLDDGTVKGVCLDVWEGEPMEKMDVNQRETLLAIGRMPQAVITPHIAGYSHEAVYKMSRTLLEKLMNY